MANAFLAGCSASAGLPRLRRTPTYRPVNLLYEQQDSLDVEKGRLSQANHLHLYLQLPYDPSLQALDSLDPLI